MTARAIVWPGSFNDDTLPRVTLSYTSPLPGATYDWAADNLPEGAISSWPSLTGSNSLVADGGTPIVVQSGASKHVAFDGVSNRMRLAFSMSAPHTVVTVFRYVTLSDLNVVHFGYGGAGAGALESDETYGTLRGRSSTGFITPSPAVTPDTAWHVSIITANGASSGMTIDGIDYIGNIGSNTRDGITLGYGDTNTRTKIEYKRIAVIPSAMTQPERIVLSDQLTARYL